ncbi:ABC transporter ATP-binding protein [Roseibacillus ishigakijimensis]|uniref:ATP-binding cassette domain-containing protein n=1 Tax=Roseibacillus ishigakijimensis TaxID=454146 RepID=A0A934RV99_9BACT|nr:ABC transporter transmembrane domain-containing protein [Roseibacillus ishigakijimensis]MBK1835644.1 ATP-binding cassette domain-containing protein [Roseibacillus ishigakijimensis]
MLGFYRYLANYKKTFYPALVALFVTAGLSLAFPFFLSQLIGGVRFGEAASLDVEQVKANINRTVLTLLAILGLQAFVSYWRVRGFIKAGESALNDIRRDVFRHLVHLPMSFYEKSRAGELSGRVAADLSVLRETLLTTVPQMIRQTVILVGGLVFIFVFSWKLALFMLAIIPVVVLAVAFFGRKVRGYSKSAQDALADSSIVIEESTQGISEVKSFCNEGFEEARYEQSLGDYLGVVLRGAQARAAFIAFIIFVLFGTISVVAWFGAGMLAEGELSQRGFVAFVLFSVFVGASLGSFPEIVSQIQKANGATERLKEILEETPESDAGAAGPAVQGALSARNLRFAYPSRPEVEVLKGLDFAVEPGQKIAFVGPSGGGKSTLFALLQRFHEPTSGELVLDGRALVDWSLEDLRGAIAVVPQDVHLFGGTIAENIAYGRPGASQEEIEQAAREANAAEFIEAFPEKYEAVVGPRGMRLSGGQRQRIAIARAILADPKILMLDEATSALDSESERLVQEALERLMVGRTSLIIAHRLGTVRSCDQIHVLSGGTLVESGTHDELLTANGTYALLAKTQLL